MAQGERVLKLDGWHGACWESGGSTRWSGTQAELEDSFRRNIATGYRVEESGELVPAEFFYAVGGELFRQLTYSDLIKVTGTITSLNDHMRLTGRPTFGPGQPLHDMLVLLEGDSFRKALPEDRLGVIGERLTTTAVWKAGSSFMRDRNIFLYDRKLRFNQKYPDLEPAIQTLWEKEAFEKSIQPYIAGLFAL